jgi:hypothetical protein
VWRQFFDAWEKEFGPRLEDYVQTDDFAQRMTAFQQMNRRGAEMNEEASRQFFRAWNLPTASDFEKLSQQVADIDRRLRALSQRVDEAGPAPGPRKRQGSKTPAGVKAAVESREAAAKQADAASGGAGTVEAEVMPTGTARSAQGTTDKASAGKAKTTKATPARASKSPRSPARTHMAESPNKEGDTAKASDGSEVVQLGVSPASGHRDRRRGTERAPGNEPERKA